MTIRQKSKTYAPSLVALCALIIVGCAGSGDGPSEQQITPADQPTPASIARDSLGGVFVDIETGAAIGARLADDGFIPASTAKLITALAARAALPADHRFVTRVCATAMPDGDGRLAGDLMLVGGGDPTLDMPDLLGLALRVKAAGVGTLGGRLMVMGGALPTLPLIAERQPSNAAYNPGISGLSVAENARRLEWRGDGRAWFVPDIDARAEARGLASAQAMRAGEEWLPVRHAAARTGRLFAQMMRGVGITVPVEARHGDAGPTDCPVELARHESATRDATLRAMLETSSNPMAEMMGLAAATARGEAPVDLQDAARGTARWLTRALPDVNWRGFVLPNHSGLSAAARLTPRQMTDILVYAYKQDGQLAATPFPALLGAGGWDKALRLRLADPATALRVWAKTGTMHYGIGLAGYLMPGDGRVYAFALYARDAARRATYDTDAADPPAWVEARAKAWDAAARLAIDQRLIDMARLLQAD
jgi:D-alanyl-D-alanine carboxypeptidase/D-alanyl-D-alanine-endopeptidase (penicillin-binding protein 4)